MDAKKNKTEIITAIISLILALFLTPANPSIIFKLTYLATMGLIIYGIFYLGIYLYRKFKKKHKL